MDVKTTFLRWSVGGEDLHGSAGRFRTKWKINILCKLKKNFVQTQAIVNGVIPPC